MTKVQFRQGDVLIEAVDSIPSGASVAGSPKDERNKRIVARGEFSDHAHIVTGEASVLTIGEDIYIDAEGEAALEHLLESSGVHTGEHQKISLPPGKYKVVNQYEFDPFKKTIDRVAD